MISDLLIALGLIAGAACGAAWWGSWMEAAWCIKHPPREVHPAAGLTPESDAEYYASLTR